MTKTNPSTYARSPEAVLRGALAVIAAASFKVATMSRVDDASWDELYRALEKPLYNVVYRWLWDRMESQDVVQEAFLRCWRARDRIRAEGFKVFVFRTALNLAANRRRRKKPGGSCPSIHYRMSRRISAAVRQCSRREFSERSTNCPIG